MSVWSQTRFKGGSRRHALGLWLPSAKLASRAYVPEAHSRRHMMGKRPFWFVFGGDNGGDVSIPASQWVELRHVCESDFTMHTILVSTTVGGTTTNVGVRCQIRDMNPQPGKATKLLSKGAVPDVSFGGSARHPFFLRKPYTFRQGHIIVVRIQNMQASTNGVQVVLVGVQE